MISNLPIPDEYERVRYLINLNNLDTLANNIYNDLHNFKRPKDMDIIIEINKEIKRIETYKNINIL